MKNGDLKPWEGEYMNNSDLKPWDGGGEYLKNGGLKPWEGGEYEERRPKTVGGRRVYE